MKEFASSFLDAFGDKSLRDVLADTSPVPLAELAWLGLPDEGFLRYAQRQPFMLDHAHRLSVHSGMIAPLLLGVESVVDLGAYPFAFERILRERLGYGGALLATINHPLDDGQRALLGELDVATEMLNLDPYTHDGSEALPLRSGCPDGSADMIVCNHVIEHLYHPLHMLRESARLLRPGGVLFLGTDNPHMVAHLRALLLAAEPLVDDIERSAAMRFGFWRGHNRFFSEGDLRAMIAAAGLEVGAVHYSHIIWGKETTIPHWMATLLTAVPKYRNEIVIVARKPDWEVPARAQASRNA